jgi:hypothetical protein
LQELGLPELTNEQIEKLCTIAETAARKHVLSRVPSKEIERLDISVEAGETKPLRLAVDVDIVLSPTMKGFNVEKLSDEAVREAFASSEKFLRELACHSKR